MKKKSGIRWLYQPYIPSDSPWWHPTHLGRCWVCHGWTRWAFLDVGYQHMNCDAYPVEGGHEFIIRGKRTPYRHPHLSFRERFWIYPLGSWRDHYPWPRRSVPFIGEDERAYRTLVVPIPFRGSHLVIAFRKCWRDECLQNAADYESQIVDGQLF